MKTYEVARDNDLSMTDTVDVEPDNCVEAGGIWYKVWQLTRAIAESMYWKHGSNGMMRADPSPLFWEAWHADKEGMKKIGFRVFKSTGGWFVFVKDPSLIDLLREHPDAP